MTDDLINTLVILAMLAGASSVAYKVPKKRFFVLKWIVSFVVLRVLVFQGAFYISRGKGMAAGVLCYGLLLAVLCVCMWTLFNCDIWGTVFCGIAGYLIQHIVMRSYSVVRLLYLHDMPAPVHLVVFLLFGVFGVMAIPVLFGKNMGETISVNNKMLLVIAGIAVMVTIILDLYAIQILFPAGDEAVQCGFVFSLVTALITLIMQMGLISTRKIEEERDFVRQLLEESKEQYSFEKTIIDTLNIKIHDIKHQVTALDDQDKDRVLHDTMSVIDSYDATFMTDCPPLNVVLTRKSFICQKKNIEFTCMADGAALSFMSESDVYSLVGNILDNAIEAVEKLEDPSRRVISLVVSRRDYFVTIHAVNYFDGKLTVADGLPQTTKQNTGYHGYGLKSIQMIAEQYGGNLKFTAVEDRFLLDILFSPLATKESS